MTEISKIIHQTWKSEDIPTDIYDPSWRESWLANHPGWDYKLWTDRDLRELVGQTFPEHLEFFDKAPGVVKADYGRYLVLYVHGGIYADLDYECFRSLVPLFESHRLILSWNSPRQNTLNNALLIATPHQAFFRLLAFTAASRWAAGVRGAEVATGPNMLTEIWQRCGRSPCVYPSRVLCPVDWAWPTHLAIAAGTITKETLPALRQKLIEQGAYAATYWAHNWEI